MSKKKRNYYPIEELNAYLLERGWGSFAISEEAPHSGVAVELTKGLQSSGVLPKDWVLEYTYSPVTSDLTFHLLIGGCRFLLFSAVVHACPNEDNAKGSGGEFLEVLTSKVQNFIFW